MINHEQEVAVSEQFSNIFQNSSLNKLASLEATLAWNYDPPSDGSEV